MNAALARRKRLDVAWVLKTGTPPPIRKQRTRWFVQAVNRRAK